MKFYKKRRGDGGRQMVVRPTMNAELTLLQIMISVRCEIPLGVMQKLKGIVHTKRCGGITNHTNGTQIKYFMLLLQLQSC